MSMILDVVKFILEQLWTGRTRIDVGGLSTTSDPNIGNEIVIRNLSGTPVIITYWELVWQHRHWGRWKRSRCIDLGHVTDGLFGDMKLDGHSSTTLEFCEFDYFRPDLEGRDQIYIRVHIAGRRWPIVRKVYDGR
jgi:hypothetical protein